jgi:magnesium transporter
VIFVDYIEEIEDIEEQIEELLKNRKFAALSKILKELNPADVAALMHSMPEEDLPVVFRILPKELAAETFAELDGDVQELLIKSFSDKELRAVMDELFVDDAVDMIEEMPANVVSRILRNTDADTRKVINSILKYPEDSAGSIMTIEYVYLRKDMTVKDAFRQIRQVGVDKETIYTCYVTENRKLIGTITVKDLLLSADDCVIEDIMDSHAIFVDAYEDKEIVAENFRKYGLLAMPVVDKEERLVGIVTFDDAMDVIQEENTEDIEKMAAIMPTDKPYLKTGVFETWKKRIPWLLLLMVSATFTSSILSHFEEALAAQSVLIAFIPMLMDTGGNAGGQASVTIIRGLSLNEISMGDILRIIWKEIRVAVICGITLAVVSFGKVLLIDRVSLTVAAVISATMLMTVLVAKVVGCTLPVLAKRIGFDPAVMASPFITTIVDALSLVIYFKIATLVLAM